MVLGPFYSSYPALRQSTIPTCSPGAGYLWRLPRQLTASYNGRAPFNPTCRHFSRRVTSTYPIWGSGSIWDTNLVLIAQHFSPVMCAWRLLLMVSHSENGRRVSSNMGVFSPKKWRRRGAQPVRRHYPPGSPVRIHEIGPDGGLKIDHDQNNLKRQRKSKQSHTIVPIIEDNRINQQEPI